MVDSTALRLAVVQMFGWYPQRCYLLCCGTSIFRLSSRICVHRYCCRAVPSTAPRGGSTKTIAASAAFGGRDCDRDWCCVACVELLATSQRGFSRNEARNRHLWWPGGRLVVPGGDSGSLGFDAIRQRGLSSLLLENGRSGCSRLGGLACAVDRGKLYR